MSVRRAISAASVVATLALLPASPAAAHPHVWIDASATFVFADAKLAAIAHRWTFDEVLSAVFAREFDKNRDKTFSQAELKELFEKTFESLKDYDFFMHFFVDEKRVRQLLAAPRRGEEVLSAPRGRPLGGRLSKSQPNGGDAEVVRRLRRLPQLPAADAATSQAFIGLVSFLASNVYAALGIDPMTGEKLARREPAAARQMIDWLGALEQKSRGRLSFEESDLLSRVLYELRMAYVEIVKPPGREPPR